MAKVSVYNTSGKTVGEIELSDKLFALPSNDTLLHQVYVVLSGNLRQVIAHTKDRSERAGSGIKPWKQKGTGRARAGMTSSPLWRGGGRTFPNSPEENYSQKLNRKMYRAGLCSILSQLAREERLSVVEGFSLDSPKTRLLAGKLKAMGLNDSVLVITDTVDENLFLASRNLVNVMVVEPHHADPVSLVHFDRVLITRPALAKVQEMLA